jgi:hypothetical protein
MGKLFDTSIINAGGSAQIVTAHLQPGDYPFFCSVHPYMTGTLKVSQVVGLNDSQGIDEKQQITSPTNINETVGNTQVFSQNTPIPYAIDEQQLQQQDQTATKTYLDPEGVYSIKYPAANWTLIERSNRFEDIDLTFELPKASNYSLAAENRVTLSITDISKQQNGNQSTEQLLDNIVDDARPSPFQESNFKIVEDIECANYKIANNNPTCSVLFSGLNRISMASDSAVLVVLSQVSSANIIIEFQYVTEFDNFDKYLPAVKDTIKSFQLLNA